MSSSPDPKHHYIYVGSFCGILLDTPLSNLYTVFHMNLVRAFLAIEIPADIQQKLKLLTSRLSRGPNSPVRWVKSDNIHLTLKFFGDTEVSRLEKLNACLRQEMVEQVPFELEVGGFGAFPNLNRPRVFWCGLKMTPELKAIVEMVESASTAMEFEPENRPFSPHLTLGRRSERAVPGALQDIVTAFRGFPAEPIGTVSVSELVIFRSQLSPGGSIYTPIFQIPFSDQDTATSLG
ncbi:MAG: RNA 2',3'-cyclic phosphodiesterase [Anaerolineaceae bacterium]